MDADKDDLTTAWPHDEPAHTGVGDEHVRAAAQQRHRHRRLVCEPQRQLHLVGRPGLEKKIRRPADLEGRQGRQAVIAAHSSRPEAGVELTREPFD